MTLSFYGRSPEEAVVDVMKSLYQRGLVQVRGGNASVVDRDQMIVYMSPTGVPRLLLEPKDIAILEYPSGRIIRGSPTSEWRMHLAVYEADPNAVAVVHAHPKNLLALTYRGEPLQLDLLSEAKLRATCVSRIPFIQPGSQELAEAVGNAVRSTGCNVIVLEGHGLLVYSSDSPYHALDLLEAIEDLAYIQLHLA